MGYNSLIYAPFPSAAGKSRRICPPLWRETAAIRVGVGISRQPLCRVWFTLKSPQRCDVSTHKTLVVSNEGRVSTYKTSIVPNDATVSTHKTPAVLNDVMVSIHKSPIMPNEGTALCLLIFGE